MFIDLKSGQLRAGGGELNKKSSHSSRSWRRAHSHFSFKIVRRMLPRMEEAERRAQLSNQNYKFTSNPK